jgi:myo-inositol-1-phosphate synthase
MTNSGHFKSQSVLLMVAGAKGAVASTLALAVATLQKDPDTLLPSLTTRNSFPCLGPPHDVHMAGWDTQPAKLSDCVKTHGVVPENIWKPYQSALDEIPIFQPAPLVLDIEAQVDHLMRNIHDIIKQYSNVLPVLINLLPANIQLDLENFNSLSQVYSKVDPANFPDLAYVLASILSGIPVVNFSPNHLEFPVIIQKAVKHHVPMCGRDGKTGQTYFKVLLASALKARCLHVDGWYSLNILGNADGKNLMNPERAAGKVANKTQLLDDILGYPVGEKYGEPCHKVHIDYYPPRGDAKEAWDVIDFQGMFGLPMSIRLNLQGRDSILASPLILDLSRWMAVLKLTGRSGLIPELGFYFKKPLGENPPLNFQDQVHSLRELEKECDALNTRKQNGKES